jgi:EAL domain-containing protein (putative c-di-GMP-specific phosphodiesterase class I)
MTGAPPIRVVVVDDHVMVLESVVRLLTSDERFDVVGMAATGAEAVEVTKYMRPDVLVIDFILPDVEAPEAIRQIRIFDSDVRVVTISGSGRPGALQASMKAGSTAWVRKTNTIQELRDAIVHAFSDLPIAYDQEAALPALDELVVHYQPVVSLDDGAIVGFEALVRRQHPVRGLLFPDTFLARAEETGYVEDIDRWVREKAIHQLAEWQKKFPSHPSRWMSFNLSAVNFTDSELSQSIAILLTDAGVNAADVVVELAESVLLNDSQQSQEFMDELNNGGVGLALDDFGTGITSISYIRKFPFNHLKLDISFTQEIPGSLRSLILAEEIGQLAKSMEMVGIAEGIERVEQLHALRDMGWKFGQGYLFSHPLDALACEALLPRSTLFVSSNTST